MVKHQLPDHELTICWNVVFPQFQLSVLYCVEATTVMKSTGTQIYSANLPPFFPLSLSVALLGWKCPSCFHIFRGISFSKWNCNNATHEFPPRSTSRAPSIVLVVVWRSCNVDLSVPHLRDQTFYSQPDFFKNSSIVSDVAVCSVDLDISSVDFSSLDFSTTVEPTPDVAVVDLAGLVGPSGLRIPRMLSSMAFTTLKWPFDSASKHLFGAHKMLPKWGDT